MVCTTQFKAFLEKLQLTPKQVERIESASGTIARALARYFEIPDSKIFLQGSFANGTSVRPAPSRGGEYDVDLVVVGPFEGLTPTEALEKLRKALRACGYGDRIKADNSGERPCIRLEYASEGETVGFHVDVVPARPHSNVLVAPLEVPKPAEGRWKATAPAEYTAWATGQGASYIRTVQALKRWRDEHQSARTAIKSIVLQVLISHHVNANTTTLASDAARVVAALRGIANELALSPDVPPTVRNPALDSENLAAAWPPEDYRKFRKAVGACADLAERAQQANTAAESTRLWNKLLGSDFPVVEEQKVGHMPPPVIDTRRSQEAPRSQWA